MLKKSFIPLAVSILCRIASNFSDIVLSKLYFSLALLFGAKHLTTLYLLRQLSKEIKESLIIIQICRRSICHNTQPELSRIFFRCNKFLYTGKVRVIPR